MAAGWAVFPCNPDKSPRTPNGFRDATTDRDVALAMPWDGALVGAAIPEGLFVLDVDPRNGGDETMRALRQAGHKLPRTRLVKTGGGGEHHYFRAPEGVELRGKLGRGVDVKRAGRGYVIVPPSEGYRVSVNRQPADPPDWLVEALRAPDRNDPIGSELGPCEAKFFEQFEKGTAYGLRALQAEIGKLALAREGERNDTLNAAAFAMAQLAAGGELDEQHAWDALEEVAQRIGLEPDEIEKTLRSGWEAGSVDPRQAPVRVAEEAALIRHVEDDRFWLDWEVEEPPPAFLLDPIIPENAYLLVYGPAAASKSMVFAALGAQASTRGIRTTLYSLENPPHVDRHRLRRLRPDRDNFRATNAPMDLRDPAQLEALVEREREWGARLVIIDTYSHAFTSPGDDGNAKAIAFARRVRYLMHEVGCSVVVVDHTGYAHDDPRDASAKLQQVDVGILMDRDGVWQPGRNARFTMENRKAARFGNPFDLSGEIADTEDGGLEVAWTGGGRPEWRT